MIDCHIMLWFLWAFQWDFCDKLKCHRYFNCKDKNIPPSVLLILIFSFSLKTIMSIFNFLKWNHGSHLWSYDFIIFCKLLTYHGVRSRALELEDVTTAYSVKYQKVLGAGSSIVDKKNSTRIVWSIALCKYFCVKQQCKLGKDKRSEVDPQLNKLSK